MVKTQVINDGGSSINTSPTKNTPAVKQVSPTKVTVTKAAPQVQVQQQQMPAVQVQKPQPTKTLTPAATTPVRKPKQIQQPIGPYNTNTMPAVQVGPGGLPQQPNVQTHPDKQSQLMGQRYVRDITADQQVGQNFLNGMKGLSNSIGQQYIRDYDADKQVGQNALQGALQGAKTYLNDPNVGTKSYRNQDDYSYAMMSQAGSQLIGKVTGLVNMARQGSKAYIQNQIQHSGMDTADKIRGERKLEKEMEASPVTGWYEGATGEQKRLAYNAEQVGKNLTATQNMVSQGFGSAVAMLPDMILSMGVGTALGWAGEGAALIEKLASDAALGQMFLSATGNGIQAAKDEGFDDKTANLYGLSIAAIEIATEKMSGGLNLYGESIIPAADDLIEAGIKRFKNENVQWLLHNAAGVLGEGFEEFVSEIADAYIEKYVLGKYEDMTYGELTKEKLADAYNSFVIGAISALFMNGASGQYSTAEKIKYLTECQKNFNDAPDAAKEAAVETVAKATGQTPAQVAANIADAYESAEASDLNQALVDETLGKENPAQTEQDSFPLGQQEDGRFNVDYSDKQQQDAITSQKQRDMISRDKVVELTKEDYNLWQNYLREAEISGEKAAKKTLLNKLREVLRDTVWGREFTFDINGNEIVAHVTNTSFKEVLRFVNENKSAMLQQSETVLSKAEYLYSTYTDTTVRKHRNTPAEEIRGWDYYYTPLKIGDAIVGVRIAVRNMYSDPLGQIYNWRIKENPSNGAWASPEINPANSTSYTSEGILSGNSVAGTVQNSNTGNDLPDAMRTQFDQDYVVDEYDGEAIYRSDYDSTEKGQALKKFGKSIGREIVVVKNVPNNAEGMWFNNKIFISEDAFRRGLGKPVAVKHELLHSLKGAKVFNELLEYANSQIKARPDSIVDFDRRGNRIRYKSYEDYMNSLVDRYAQYGVYGLQEGDTWETIQQNPELADMMREEAAAFWVQNNLFQDDAAVKQLVRSSRSTAERIWQTLKDMVRKFTGLDDEYVASIRRAERMFASALAETKIEGPVATTLNPATNPITDADGNKITPAEKKILTDIGPGVQFSIATFRKPEAKGKYGASTNNGKGGFAGLSEIIAGKDVLRRTMAKNNFSDAQINTVTGFLEHMANHLQDSELQGRYNFIGWGDLENAEVTVRKNADGDIVSVAVSAMVANGEYPVNFDMTTICNKREGIMQVIQELSRKYDADTGKSLLNSIKLTDKNMWSINEALKAEGIDTACLGCFVEARRYYTNNFVEKVDEVWNNAVREARERLGLDPEVYFNFAEGKQVNGEDYNMISDLWTAYDESKDSKRSPSQRIKILMDEIVRNGEVDSPYLKLISASDLMTPEGIRGFKELSTHNRDRDMVKLIKSIYGTSAPKEILAFTPYNSEIALLPDEIKGQKTGDYLRSIGGTRVQSFSDFKMEHFFDHMQMVADEAARGFPNHGYSKVIAYPRLFGLTGRKINMSVMFDVLPASEWQKRLGCSEETAEALAKKYQGLQFVEERPFFNDDNRPYIPVTIEGKDGYLTYLVSDADYVNSVYERLYQENLAAGMSEEQARRKANKDKPFEQSINYSDAVELENREGYKNNVGIVAVAYGDEHFRMLLDDPNVRYIIPYHRSGLSAFIAGKTSLNVAKDFTMSQNTGKVVRGLWKRADGSLVKLKNEYSKYLDEHSDEEFPAISFFADINDQGYKAYFGEETDETGKKKKKNNKLHGTGYDVYENLDKAVDIKEISNAYLEWCIENGYAPVFYDFAGHPNYYKTLFDFAVTDADGVIHPQGPVRNIYPGLNLEEIADEIESSGMTMEKFIANNPDRFSEFYEEIERAAAEQNAKNERRAEGMSNVLDDILSRDSENSIIADSNIQHIENGTPDYNSVKYGAGQSSLLPAAMFSLPSEKYNSYADIPLFALDPRSVTKEDALNLLENALEGQYDPSTYIPILPKTPDGLLEYLYSNEIVADSLPISLLIEKIYQASEYGTSSDGKIGHELTADEIYEIISNLDKPLEVYLQKNRNIGVIVPASVKNHRALAIIKLNHFIDTPYMNGYDGGHYNATITLFEPDSKRLKNYRNDPRNKKLEKNRSKASYFQANLPLGMKPNFYSNSNTTGNEVNTNSNGDVLPHGMFSLPSNSLDPTAKRLKKAYGSKMSTEEISSRLNELFHSFDTMDFSEAEREELAGYIARDIADMIPTRKAISTESQHVLNTLKDITIRLTDSQKSEARHAFGDLREFQKAIAPVKMRNDGEMLTDAWLDWSQDSGSNGMIDTSIPEDSIPSALAELVGKLKDTHEELDYDVIEEITSDILEAYNNQEADVSDLKDPGEIDEFKDMYGDGEGIRSIDSTGIAQKINGNKRMNGFDSLFRTLDRAAGGDNEVRTWFDKMIERPMYEAHRRYNEGRIKAYDELQDIVDKYGIKAGTKESAAIQWYGEGYRVNEDGSRERYGLNKLKQEFPDSWEKIQEAEGWFRNKYDEYVDRINSVLEQIYPDVEEKQQQKIASIQYNIDQLKNQADDIEAHLNRGEYSSVYSNDTLQYVIDQIAREEKALAEATKAYESGEYARNKRLVPRKDYFHHFQDVSEKGIGDLKNLFRGQEVLIDTNLVGISDTTKPKSRWMGFLQHQGKGEFTADAVGGMARYMPSAEYAIAFDPAIAHMRSVVTSLRDSTKKTRNANGLISYLSNFTNDLAGKTAGIDRAVTNFLGEVDGRATLDAIRKLNSRFKANAVGANVRSALAQFSNLPNGIAIVKSNSAWLKGIRDYADSIVKGGSDILDQSVFMTERYFDGDVSQFEKPTLGKKISDASNWMLEFGDKQAARLIWFSAYEEAMEKGLDDPVYYADRCTQQAVAGRGVGEVPYNMSSKMVNLFAPFQVEVNNTWQQLKKMTNERDARGMMRFMLSSWVFEGMMESLLGIDVIPDIFGTVVDTALKLIGGGDDDDDEEESVRAILTQGVREAIGQVVSAIPGASLIAQNIFGIDSDTGEKLFGEGNPSRYGVGLGGLAKLGQTAGDVVEAIANDDKSLGDVDLFGPLVETLMPFGGRQLTRSYKTAQDYGVVPSNTWGNFPFAGGERNTLPGSYTSKGALRFELPTDDPWEMAKAFLLGEYATDAGREYLENGRKTVLTQKQVEAMNEYAASGGDPHDYMQFIKGANTDGNSSISQAEAQEYLDGTNMDDDQKSLIWSLYGTNWKKNPYAETPSEETPSGEQAETSTTEDSTPKLTEAKQTKLDEYVAAGHDQQGMLDFYSGADADGNGRIKQEEAIEWFETSDLDDVQKALIWNLMWPKSAAKNPYD